VKSQKVRAAIAFIAVHFGTYFIYLAMVGHNGFALHMTQALPYIALSTLNINFKLRIVSLLTALAYILIAVNWLILERGIELKIQELFYSSFASIIMTLNLIVILIIGTDSGIHLFNRISNAIRVFNKSRLFFGSAHNNRVLNCDLSISKKNTQGEKRCR
jgi:hypothetical protein